MHSLSKISWSWFNLTGTPATSLNRWNKSSSQIGSYVNVCLWSSMSFWMNLISLLAKSPFKFSTWGSGSCTRLSSGISGISSWLPWDELYLSKKMYVNIGLDYYLIYVMNNIFGNFRNWPILIAYVFTKFFCWVGRKWKSPREIFDAPPAHKKGVAKFFASAGLLSLRRHVKPLKPQNFQFLFQKIVKFFKIKGAQIFFACGGFFNFIF